MYTYLLINIATLLVPVIFSFEKKLYFVSYWRWVWPSVVLSALLFIVWDHFFTVWGIWSFTPAYLSGPHIWALPLEEIFFFISVPFACLFIYEVLNFYVSRDYLKPVSRLLNFLLLCLCIWLVFNYPERLYTSVAALLAAALLTWHNVFYSKPWMGRFWRAYIVTLLPFFLVNGILTAWPVVNYNDEFNLGLRMGTIPVEDLLYHFDLFLLNITLYEKQKTLFKSKAEV